MIQFIQARIHLSAVVDYQLNGSMHNSMEHAYDTPVLKNETKQIPKKYHLISLTSVICKAMEHSQLIKILHPTDILQFWIQRTSLLVSHNFS